MSEILKTLWAKLYAWAFPAAVILGVFYFFVYPKVSIGHDWFDKATDTQKAAIFAAATGTVAYLLSAFSTPLYRLLEGYLWPSWLQRCGTQRQLERKRRLAMSVASGGWQRGLDLEKLELYPVRDDQVVPTRFGNAIRSFETYGKTRFNLDTQTLWYELLAVSSKEMQAEIKDANSVVDFFVAFTYLGVALGLASLAVAACNGFELSIGAVCIIGFVVAISSHWLAVRSTRAWGYTVQALVNIGRVKLAESLGLQLPETLEAEKKMWGLVTRYGFFCRENDGAELNQFRKKHETTGREVPPEVRAERTDAEQDGTAETGEAGGVEEGNGAEDENAGTE